jgi:hypothetical protein
MSAMLEFPATLTRELPVRIIDMSASGCLIETWRSMEVGTIGMLQLRIGGEDCRDEVEIARCHAVKGQRALYHIGVRFLWTTPREGSIRHAVASRQAEWERSGAPRPM